MIQPGDLLLWKVSPDASLIERAIGWAERRLGDQQGAAAYYHVAIVAQNRYKMYSAQPPKIDLYDIPSPLPSYIETYRLINVPSQAQLDLIFKYAESRRGKLYDFIGCLTAGFLEIGGLEFCSQYTEDSFEQAQIVLSPDVKFTTPDDIANSLLLIKVP